MALVFSMDRRGKVVRAPFTFATFIAFAVIVPVLAAASCSSADDTPGALSSNDASTAQTDSGVSTDALAGSCVPGDVSSFTGGDYQPPAGAHQGKCDDDLLEAYIDCRQNANPVACNLFASGDGATCLSCLESKPSDPNWGPVVLDASGANGTPNLPGCLALVFGEGQSTTGCGASLQQSLNCQTLACGANCASSSDASTSSDLADLTTCENAAVLGGCKSFADSATTACAQDAGGADSICYRATYQDGGASEDVWSYIARLDGYFCGDPIGDAGSSVDGG